MIKYILVFFILLSSTALAYSPGNGPLTTVNYGENATLRLEPYTRHYMKIYEGSAVQFSIYDTNGRILEHNNLIIKNIREDKTETLLSIAGSKYKDFNLILGEENKINFTDKSVPFMFIKEDTLHYSTNKKDRYIIVYFNVPEFYTKKIDTTGNAIINLEGVEGVIKPKETFTTLKIVIVLLAIIAIVATVYLFKKSE